MSEKTQKTGRAKSNEAAEQSGLVPAGGVIPGQENVSLPLDIVAGTSPEEGFERLTGTPVISFGKDIKPGMAFTGTLTRLEKSRSDKIKTGLAIFRHANGQEYAFGLSKVLSSAMSDKPESFIGRRMQIRYLGKQKSGNGGKAYHKLEVLAEKLLTAK